MSDFRTNAVANAISFDVEEYFHALNFRSAGGDETTRESRVTVGVNRILEVLEVRKVRATFFILGRVAKVHPDMVRRIVGAGHEVASHGMSHRTIHELGPEGFRAELYDSKALLEDLTGRLVIGFRASTFSITRTSLWALDLLLETGYRYDSSIFPVYHDRYGIPDFPVTPVTVRGSEPGSPSFRKGASLSESLVEFPPLTLSLFRYRLPCGGGGYFRLFPLALTDFAVRCMNRRGGPAVLYLHPWELDPDQPRERLGGLRTFRHYVGIGKTAERLDRLLRSHSFRTMSALAEGPERWPVDDRWPPPSP